MVEASPLGTVGGPIRQLPYFSDLAGGTGLSKEFRGCEIIFLIEVGPPLRISVSEEVCEFTGTRGVLYLFVVAEISHPKPPHSHSGLEFCSDLLPKSC